MTVTKVLVWGAAVAVAIGLGTAAVALAEGRDDTVLSQDDVNRELETLPAAAPSGTADPSAIPDVKAPPGSSAAAGVGPSAGGAPATPGPGNLTKVSSRAGVLVVGCSGTTAELASWSVNPGYRADDVIRGPAQMVSVWFESDRADDVKAMVTCVDDRPVLTEAVEPDDHGGDG